MHQTSIIVGAAQAMTPSPSSVLLCSCRYALNMTYNHVANVPPGMLHVYSICEDADVIKGGEEFLWESWDVDALPFDVHDKLERLKASAEGTPGEQEVVYQKPDTVVNQAVRYKVTALKLKLREEGSMGSPDHKLIVTLP